MNRWMTLAASLCLASWLQAADAPRPNIIFILADDMGFSDLGCYGGEIRTPHIDALAASGVKFAQFYNNARCCPTRASIMTGKYPHQVGVGEMIDNYARKAREAADSPAYSDHLSADVQTLPEALHAAGYHTLMAGKWHLGSRPAEWPVKRGFDRSFVQIMGAMNYYGSESTGPFAPMAIDDQRWTPPRDGFYSTDAFTDHAIDFVKEAKEKGAPFFLYLAYNAPHWPLQAPADEIAAYKGTYDAGWQATRRKRHQKQLSLGLVDAKWGMAPMDRGNVEAWNKLDADHKANWERRMETYAAQITHLDAGVGKLLDTLKQLGIDQNTVVVFLSDNGGAAEDPNRSRPGAEIGTRDSFIGYDRPWATVSNTPFKLHKCDMQEGGISAPLIVSWPGHLAPSTDWIRPPAQIMDLMPTCLEWAGAKAPAGLEGISLLPLLGGQADQYPAERSWCWEHEGNRGARIGKWKLVALSGQPWELYDLAADRCEKHNIAAENPEQVQRLTAAYDAWAKRCGVIPREKLVAR